MKKITLLLFAFVAFCWHSKAQLNEGFDTAGLPAGWVENEISGADANWVFGAANNQDSSVAPRTGAGMAYFFEGSYADETTRIESPSQDLTSLTTPILTFYYTQVDWGGDQDELSIWYKDGAAGTWTMLEEYTGSVSAWTEVNIILPSPSADYYIGFQGKASWGRGVTVDDVSISEAPNCLAPGNLDVTITSTTEASLNWTATGSETDFTYEYGDVGFVQGTGTISVITGISAPITGLTTGNDYDFYVQANCGVDGDSSFSGPFTWTQPDSGESCATAFVATIEADCGTATPLTLDFTGAPSNVSTSCDTFNNYGLWVTTMTDASGGLRINASAAVDMAIYDACNGTDVECFDTGIMPSVDLLLTPNTAYYMYFWQEGTASTAMVDVCISLPPSCIEPSGLTASTTGLDTVDFTWTAGNTETDWTYEYGVSPYAQGGGGTTGTVMTTPTLSLSGLTSGETYDIYVQANCGVDGDSAYVTTSWTQPPTNDTFAGATPIAPSAEGAGCATFNFMDSTSGDGTTDSGLDGTCNGTDTGLDRFYSWTATTDALVWNDGAGNPGIVIRDAGTEAEITCEGTFADDDVVLTGWTIGQDLIIQVYDFGGADVDVTFCLELFTLPSAPDCAEAPISPMNGATEVAVLATGGALTATWTAPSTGITPTEYEFFIGVTSGDLTSLGTTADTFFDLVNLNVNTTYYWQVVPLNGASAASGCMEWSFTTETVAAPINDDCANATALTAGAVFEDNPVDGTVLAAAADAEAAACGITGSGVWYSVVVPASGDITLEVGDDSLGGTGFDSVIEAFSGTCGSLVSLGCDDDGVPGFGDAYSQLELTGLTGGDTIYLRVWEYGGDEFETFSVSAFSASLSVGDFDNEAAFTYYPNPVKNTLTLNAQNTIEQVAMYNMLGQEVLRANPNTVDSDLDMSQLQTGTYFVKVTIANVTETIRVIKQ